RAPLHRVDRLVDLQGEVLDGDVEGDAVVGGAHALPLGGDRGLVKFEVDLLVVRFGGSNPAAVQLPGAGGEVAGVDDDSHRYSLLLRLLGAGGGLGRKRRLLGGGRCGGLSRRGLRLLGGEVLQAVAQVGQRRVFGRGHPPPVGGQRNADEPPGVAHRNCLLSRGNLMPSMPGTNCSGIASSGRIVTGTTLSLGKRNSISARTLCVITRTPQVRGCPERAPRRQYRRAA